MVGNDYPRGTKVDRPGGIVRSNEALHEHRQW